MHEAGFYSDAIIRLQESKFSVHYSIYYATLPFIGQMTAFVHVVMQVPSSHHHLKGKGKARQGKAS